MNSLFCKSLFFSFNLFDYIQFLKKIYINTTIIYSLSENEQKDNPNTLTNFFWKSN